MIALALALCSALSYGVSDFVGGVCAKKASVWSVAVTAQVTGAVLVTLVAVAGGGTSGARPGDHTWGLVAGLGNGVGTVFLYRGLSSGRMGVVAPVSAIGAALVPVAVALVLGERPSPFVCAGIAAGLPGIWLVSRQPQESAPGGDFSGDAPGDPPGDPRGEGLAGSLRDGILAGLGFGVLFAALAQIPASAGWLPLATNQVVGAGVVIASALLVRQQLVPRTRSAWGGGLAGLLGVLATGTFMVATRFGDLTMTVTSTRCSSRSI